MRVLIVASETPPVLSGVARSVSRLAQGLTARGHEVAVLSAADAPYLARGDFRISGLAARIPRILRDLSGYDVINVHGPAPTISDSFLAALGLIPRNRRPALVYTHHFTVELGHRWLQPLLRSYDVLARGLGRLADHIVVTSDSYAHMLSGREGTPELSVIPWGIDLDRFNADDTDPYTGQRDLRVLYVGQLREYKGAHIALEAIADLDGVSLTLIGKGPCEGALRAQLADRGASNVDLRGYVTDEELITEYTRHDIVLLPSVNRLEAFGIAVLEGMASGCVPVVSDLPGVSDLASECGMLAAPNDPADLRWAVAMLASRPELVAELRARAITQASGYPLETTSDSYERLFRHIVRSKSATAS